MMDRELPEIFEEIVDLTTTEQAAFLDERCRGRPALRDRIERLLRNDRAIHDEGSYRGWTAIPLPEPVAGAAAAIGAGTYLERGQHRGHRSRVRHDTAWPDWQETWPGSHIGAWIGRYRISERLDEGGMGLVYVADHDELARRVVVKVLRPELAGRRDMVKRFRAEAHIAARIHHPGIVEVLDIGSLDDGSLFIMMEHLAGETLRHRLDRDGAMPAAHAVALIQQAARALAAAHHENIIHRDLKPSNIVVVRDPEVPGGERAKLLDFGIAKQREEPRRLLALANMALGTPPYMPPEQFRDAADVDPRADLYALGVILYEMVTGQLPFQRSSVGSYARAHRDETPPPVRGVNPAVPCQLAEVIHRLLEKDRENRPLSALALVDALLDVPANALIEASMEAPVEVPVEAGGGQPSARKASSPGR